MATQNFCYYSMSLSGKTSEQHQKRQRVCDLLRASTHRVWNKQKFFSNNMVDFWPGSM
uniref:Uncharacterized protein n=1 Tax=Lepeophtheirus salmonis TaxID=72036 RepID=A0A0K2TI14_LEPSM